MCTFGPRSGVSEYVGQVPVGCVVVIENFWAAVSGYCSGHESGDKALSGFESYSTSGSGCNNGSPANSDDYDPTGYLYAVDLPAATTSLKLDVYDAAFRLTLLVETATRTYSFEEIGGWLAAGFEPPRRVDLEPHEKGSLIVATRR